MALDEVDFEDLKRTEKKQNPELTWECEDTFMVRITFKGGPMHGVIVAKGLMRMERGRKEKEKGVQMLCEGEVGGVLHLRRQAGDSFSAD